MKRNLRLALESLEGKQLMTGLSYAISAVPVELSGHQEIELTLTITNTDTIKSGQNERVLEVASLDGFVAKQNGQAVWQSNAGFNPLLASVVSLAPGRSTQITAFWNETSNVGTHKVGTAITGVVTFDNQLAPPVTTTVIVTTPKPTSFPFPISTPTPTPKPILNPLLASMKK